MAKERETKWNVTHCSCLFSVSCLFFIWQLACTINRQMGEAAHGAAPRKTSFTGIYSLNCYWLVKLVKFCTFKKNTLQQEEPWIWNAHLYFHHTSIKNVRDRYLEDNIHLGTGHRECYYPKCDWAGPGSVSQERLACWTTSPPGCNLLTRCLWTWYSPDRKEPLSALQRFKIIKTINWTGIDGVEVTDSTRSYSRLFSYYHEVKTLQHEPILVRMLTLELSMISGARYQRVATYSVRNPVWSWSGSATRAKPKSQICRREETEQRKTVTFFKKTFFYVVSTVILRSSLGIFTLSHIVTRWLLANCASHENISCSTKQSIIA